jgi:hypothetical protein
MSDEKQATEGLTYCERGMCAAIWDDPRTPPVEYDDVEAAAWMEGYDATK